MVARVDLENQRLSSKISSLTSRRTSSSQKKMRKSARITNVWKDSVKLQHLTKTRAWWTIFHLDNYRAPTWCHQMLFHKVQIQQTLIVHSLFRQASAIHLTTPRTSWSESKATFWPGIAFQSRTITLTTICSCLKTVIHPSSPQKRMVNIKETTTFQAYHQALLYSRSRNRMKIVLLEKLFRGQQVKRETENLEKSKEIYTGWKQRNI